MQYEFNNFNTLNMFLICVSLGALFLIHGMVMMKTFCVYNLNHEKPHNFQHDGIFCVAIKGTFFRDSLPYNKKPHIPKIISQ